MNREEECIGAGGSRRSWAAGWKRALRRGVLSGAGMVLMGGALLPCTAVAHAGLTKSNPGSRATLVHAPVQIELCFNEHVELSFSTVRLFAPNEAAIPLGALVFGQSGMRCIVAPLTTAIEQPGIYTVKYKVLSQDGHVVDYGYTFNLRPPAE